MLMALGPAPWPTPPRASTKTRSRPARAREEGALTAEDGVVLGDNLRFAGRLDEASAVLERTVRENPRFAQPWISLAEVHVKKQKLAAAAAAYEQVLRSRPTTSRRSGASATSPCSRRRRRGGPPVRADPRDRARGRRGDDQARVSSGCGRGGRTRRSRSSAGRSSASRRTARRCSTSAGALASSGHPAEALPFFERALAAGQRTTMALNGLGLTRLAVGDRERGGRGVPRVAAARPEPARRRAHARELGGP